MSILENENRIGRFTSSQIWKLMRPGKGKRIFGEIALSYIQDKRYERMLGRSIDSESNARPLEWGKLMEIYVFKERLGLEYKLSSKQTVVHPSYPDIWSGSIDTAVGKKVVSDIKCPFTMREFASLVHGGTIESLRVDSDMGEKYYWQLVSNCIIAGCDTAELLIYVPYKKDLKAIQEYLSGFCKWIQYASEMELPWINEGGRFTDLTKIKFNIPTEDKAILTERVVAAGALLEKI